MNQHEGITANGRKEQSINVVDIVKYLISEWKWFALSILVFGAIYYYQYKKSPFIYKSIQTVMIKIPANTPVTARLTRTNAGNSVNVKSEMLQLRSKELMQITLERIGAETNYLAYVGLRQNELYKDSPVRIFWPEKGASHGADLLITPVDATTVRLRKMNGDDKNREINVLLNKETKTPFGILTVQSTPFYNASAYGKDIRVVKQPISSVVGYFLSNLNITQLEGDAGLLQLTLEDTNPERAAAVITELIAVYNQRALKDKNQIAVNTEEFIRERLAIIENELGSVESNIERLRTANQGVDVATAGQMYLSDSRQFQSERTKVETDISLAKMMRDYLTSKDGQYELMPNNTGLVDASVESQIGEYNTMLLRRNRLVEGSSASNPVVTDLDKNLKSMRDNIYEATKNTLDGLKIKASNLVREENSARGKAMQMPKKQRMMLSVERQQKVKEELYLYLLNKREENAINQAMTDQSIRVIDAATSSNAPVYPSMLRKIATGLAFGIILPTAILLIILMSDTKVRSRRDIERAISVPFLGEIPLSSRKAEGKANILVTLSGRDPLTEAFRILRTNINFMTRDGNEAKVITLTSFGVGAGKTFTTLNLAMTLSYLGKKVAIVDLDLRKGSLSERLDLKGVKGISHYLSQPNLQSLDIKYTSAEMPDLDIFPAGIIAPNPVELLLSKRLDMFMESLRDLYDYIIVDGVPIGIVADADIVDRISDLTLFIIRSGRMDRRQIPDIEQIYENKKIRNLAIVLNGLKLDRFGYGYGYGYGEDSRRGFLGLLKRKA